ncbi:MAG: superoxide dismutase [Bacteroidetes bacterium]|nr:superoxide dismutase [Bacteroidota bacterium]
MSHHFEFPALPYAYDALEPYIDKMTMEIHHTKHHRAYYDKFMAAIAGQSYENDSFEEIFGNISKLPAAVRNNGGGYFNHNLYWTNMGPNKGGEPDGELGSLIKSTFGSFESFKEKFNDAAANRFGSGWAWLLLNKDHKLIVTSSPNQDNPLMDMAEQKGVPILALDVWEHAYYLKYQNRRPDYIQAFWNVVNWDEVARRFAEAK